MIFVNSMSDLFHKGVPSSFVDKVFETMEAADWHIFQILTKRSSVMREYLRARYGDSRGPSHIWCGVSVEDREATSRIGHLRRAPAGLRFLSVEPLIGPVGALDLEGIDWVIVGGEFGPRARPMRLDWVREVRDQCVARGVAFFFKQWGGFGQSPVVESLTGVNGANFRTRAFGSRSRRMNKPYSWTVGEPPPVLGGHSIAKHDIYEEYVRIYIERLTRTPSQTMLNLTIVDGFCGGGIYRLGGQEVDGSPLRLLRAVDVAEKALNEARAKGFAIKADFFFIDEDQEHARFLTDALQRRGYGPRLGEDIFVRQATFEEACPDILAHIQKKGTAQRSLFLLDQYGWSDVRFRTIRKILRALKKPEILLTFAVDALIDFLSLKTAGSRALLNIELNREDVRELIDLKTGEGWRYLIQNGLYHHVQAQTGARFYTPFFIRSVDSHRAYWLLHLSDHRQARDEMGKLHWRLNNCFCHHGGPGFHALGFDPSCDLRQTLLTFMFDDDAMSRSEAAVLEQLPRMIHAATHKDGALLVEELFAGNCNDTPVTSDILTRQLVFLRDERELEIMTPEGVSKPRSKTIGWGDRLVLPRERSLFTRLGW